jgi:hypothetical protein
VGTPARLGLFVAALGAVFAASFALGAASDDETPVPTTTVTVDHDDHG